MLPVDAILPDLRRALAASPSAVLVAVPGAGKTTRVPLALLDAPWLGAQRIVMLEPRRLAARAAAARMAATLGEVPGHTVGYQIRNDRRVSSRTRILVVTEGILTRMLQDDPGLDGTGLVIFDEFHERSLIGDTGLALTLATRDLLRDDLRVLVMSATIDGAAVARLLGDAPVIASAGRIFPVTTLHRPGRADQRVEAQVAAAVREALAEESGSLLAFLPGAAEIRRTADLLQGSVGAVDLYPLHGTLPVEQQDAAIAPAPPGRRKVVLATNIAETSLTIEGVRVVIDSGWMRGPRFSPRTGMTRLETTRISRASADQRRGRAGRLEPGVCIRCWSAAEDAGLVPFARPEILEADLAPLALDLAAAGFDDPAALRWLDPPPAAAFAQARDLLALLGALDARGRLTPHGRAMARLGTHPRYAHLLLRARASNEASMARAAALVAVLEERDLLRGIGGPPPADLRLRLDAVERQLDGAMLGAAEIDRNGLARVRDAAAEWRRRMEVGGRADPAEADDPGLLLAQAFPDRVAQQRGSPGRFVLRNGRGAMLRPNDPLAHEPWIVAPQLDDSGRDAMIHLAAPVAIDDLVRHAAEQIADLDEIRFDDGTGAVVARRRTMLGALTIGERHLPAADPDRIRQALVDGIRAQGIGALPWRDDVASLRARLGFLHAIDPDWPDVSDAALQATIDTWLAPFITSERRVSAITADLLRQALLHRVPAHLVSRLDTLAPERLPVPTGSQIAIDYGDPAAPTLAVRLQEVFGMIETPRLAGGRVPVTMHLLSPARRPVQVTRDLASFWKTGYFDVRKDLRGRYPKHHWPDDPLTAEPVRGTKKRSEKRE